MSGAEYGDGLVGDVLLVGFELFGPTFPDELDDPARVQVHRETNASARLAEAPILENPLDFDARL